MAVLGFRLEFGRASRYLCSHLGLWRMYLTVTAICLPALLFSLAPSLCLVSTSGYLDVHDGMYIGILYIHTAIETHYITYSIAILCLYILCIQPLLYLPY